MDEMGIIGHRSSKNTFGANDFVALAIFLLRCQHSNVSFQKELIIKGMTGST